MDHGTFVRAYVRGSTPSSRTVESFYLADPGVTNRPFGRPSVFVFFVYFFIKIALRTRQARACNARMHFTTLRPLAQTL